MAWANGVDLDEMPQNILSTLLLLTKQLFGSNVYLSIYSDF